MRRQPVAFFLGDAAFLSDSKFRQLMRRLPEPDEFNSAVGAYFIALAAARRNGLPDIDVSAETQSRYLDDLCAVGLLCPTGFPDKAFREWAPSRPKYPSDLRPEPAATDAPSAPSATDPPFTPARKPSTPLPSTSTPLSGGGAGEGLPNLDKTIAKVWEEATGRSVLSSGDFALSYLDDACRRHPSTEVGAAIIRARKTFDHIPAPQPLIVAVRAILDPLPDPKATAAKEREAEQARQSRKATEATLARIHGYGGHATERNPRCPSCQEGDAA